MDLDLPREIRKVLIISTFFLCNFADMWDGGGELYQNESSRPTLHHKVKK